MAKILKIIFLFFVLIISCEKQDDNSYTLRFYGDAYEDAAYSVAVLPDGYVIAGQETILERDNNNFILSSDKNLSVIKTGFDGKIIWKISAGDSLDDCGSKIIPLSGGSVICAGTGTVIDASGKKRTDIFLVKISQEGSIEWQKKIGGPGNLTGRDIIATGDGFLVLGTTDAERAPVSDSTGNRAGRKDIYILKVNSTGNPVDSYTYGYPGDDTGESLKENPDGGYIILGTTDRSEPGQAKKNLIIIKINSDGNTSSALIIGGTDDEIAGDFEVLDDGYMIAGTATRDNGEKSIYLTRLHTNIFSPPFAGFPKLISVKGGSCEAEAIARGSGTSFIIAGRWGKSDVPEMLIFETDSNGNEKEGRCLISGSAGSQSVYDVASDNGGFIIGVGSNRYENNSMITFLKFRF